MQVKIRFQLVFLFTCFNLVDGFYLFLSFQKAFKWPRSQAVLAVNLSPGGSWERSALGRWSGVFERNPMQSLDLWVVCFLDVYRFLLGVDPCFFDGAFILFLKELRC